MNKEYAGLGDVVYVTLNNGETIKIGMSVPSSQDKSIDLTISETEKERHDKLKEELFCTPPRRYHCTDGGRNISVNNLHRRREGTIGERIMAIQI